MLVNVCQPHKPTSKVHGASVKEKEMLGFEMVGLQDFFTAPIEKPLALFWSNILADLLSDFLVPISCLIFWLIYLSYTTLSFVQTATCLATNS